MRRQEELEKKAAELDRRERELQSHGAAGQSVRHSLTSLTSESEGPFGVKARFTIVLIRLRKFMCYLGNNIYEDILKHITL